MNHAGEHLLADEELDRQERPEAGTARPPARTLVTRMSVATRRQAAKERAGDLWVAQRVRGLDRREAEDEPADHRSEDPPTQRRSAGRHRIRSERDRHRDDEVVGVIGPDERFDRRDDETDRRHDVRLPHDVDAVWRIHEVR